MSPQEISEILFKIFSNDGFKVGGLTIKSMSPINGNIISSADETIIKFEKNYPKVSIKRFITLSASIEALSFKKDSGSIKLKNFPNINFSYAKPMISFLERFQSQEDIILEIETKYNDETKKKIAHKCLQYGTEWATIVSESGGFYGLNDSSKKSLRSQCVKFVVDNVRKDIEDEKKYGSVIITYLLVFIIIPAIARFIITRLLEKYF